MEEGGDKGTKTGELHPSSAHLFCQPNCIISPLLLSSPVLFLQDRSYESIYVNSNALEPSYHSITVPITYFLQTHPPFNFRQPENTLAINNLLYSIYYS
jgi:hypothetical protein